MKELLSKYSLGTIEIRYYMETDTKHVGLVLLPEGRTSDAVSSKECRVEPLVQLKILGDDYPGGFSHGHTMRNSESVYRFQYEKQYIAEEPDSKTVVTVLKDNRGLSLEHRLTWYYGAEALESCSVFINGAAESVSLEMLSSFTIGEITPFESDDAQGALVLHRLRSAWSAEGRLESLPVESLELEPAWAPFGTRCERYGQIGSMPVRKFFPYAVIEDTKNKVSWGIQIACPSSWQIEVSRTDSALCVSGGLADREFGHWTKQVAPGEAFVTPKAILSVSEGGVDDVSRNLTSLHSRYLNDNPSIENELPIIFNEFCTTWGNPTEENIQRAVDALKNRGITYFVIDCGWYKEDGRNWGNSMGDWKLCEALFPNGFEKTLDYIRTGGMIPGIWFEFEICGRQSDAFNNTEHLLKRDGYVITTGDRRFWDMSDPFVTGYLTEKVIDFLKKYSFGYLKIDYNDNIGIGCDGSESYGEGLRQKLLATQRFIGELRKQIPELIIENCSSGGHRLEPSMMFLTSMSSFSDAHECIEIPIIAANLHRAILPRQSQIWAVLRKDDGESRLVYSLANTFLGRMCLSGDVFDLNEGQWEIVDKSIKLYKRVSSTIRDGISYRYGPEVKSYRHLEGWQAIIRVGSDKKQAFAVIHTFGGTLPDTIRIENPDIKMLAVTEVFCEKGLKAEMKNGCLEAALPDNFQAMVICLEQL
ncbi:MAG TPA: glycoside hydrolase family 36 protein [Clostridia bacterium]|nr:glycoside hydrolase family 36 protein [Clostridia bacterium]